MPTSHSRLLVLTASPRFVQDPTPAPVDPPEGPAAPSGLVATAFENPLRIELTWVDNSDNELGFAIDRGAASGPKPFHDSVGAGVTSYTDFLVSPGETWFYSVRAFNDAGSSNVSNEVSATVASEGVTLEPDFNSPIGDLIQGQDYDLRARVLNPDQTVHTNYNAADWDFVITAGASFGSIGGANGDVLTVNPGTSGNSITVEATYVGSETLDPMSVPQAFNIIASTGGFPDNESNANPNLSQLTLVTGTTLDLGSGWNPSNGWQNNQGTRIDVVSDPAAKFSSAIEKRFFIGDGDGWNGALNIFHEEIWKEVYFRMIYKFSPNWETHSGGGEKITVSSAHANTILIELLNVGVMPFMWHWITDLPVSARIWRFIIPGSPTFTGGGGLTQGPFPSLAKNQYHTIEIWKRMNDSGLHNGSLRTWIDGVEYTRYSVFGAGGGSPFLDFTAIGNIEWRSSSSPGAGAPGISTNTEMPLFWGGQGDTKTVNDWIRVSELYISATN